MTARWPFWLALAVAAYGYGVYLDPLAALCGLAAHNLITSRVMPKLFPPRRLRDPSLDPVAYVVTFTATENERLMN